MKPTFERRAHARIAVPIQVRVLLGKNELELEARDVSRSGVFLFTDKPPGQVGTVLQLRLSLLAGIKPVEVKAEMVRIVMDPDRGGGAVLGFGAQFVDMGPQKEREILDLLDRAMLGRGTARRIHPRVYQLIEIRCRTRTELKAMLQDIGEGGVGLTLDRSMALDEEVALEIGQGKEPPLKVHGWVVSCVPAGPVPGSYRVGLRFGRLAGPAREELRRYLKRSYRK